MFLALLLPRILLLISSGNWEICWTVRPRPRGSLLHLQSVRDKRVEQLSAAEETLAKQEAYIVELTEQVRVAKLATKTPPESEVGAESSADSDLKSHADESMAGEQDDAVLPF